jgi:hypothetical protein
LAFEILYTIWKLISGVEREFLDKLFLSIIVIYFGVCIYSLYLELRDKSTVRRERLEETF